MGRGGVMLLAVVGVGLQAGTCGSAAGEVFCKKRSGVVVARAACRRREAPLDLIGPPGPRGAQGEPGVAGPPGPGGLVAAFSTSQDTGAPLSSFISGDLVGSLDLSAGIYVILADVQIQPDGTNPDFATCSLTAEGDTATRDVGGPTDSQFVSTVLSLHLTHEFTAPGTVSLRCHDSLAQPSRWDRMRLTALNVNTLTIP